MIRAFFNIRLDDTWLAERTGQPVADLHEARAVACTIVRSLVVQHGGEPRLLNAVMAVTNAHGAPLLDLSFFEALYVPVDPPGRAADLRRAAAIRAPGPVDAALARLRSVLGPVAWSRLVARAANVRPHLASVIDLLTLRRDPRQRSAPEPGR